MSTTTENARRLLQSLVPASSLRPKVSTSAGSASNASALGVAAYSSGEVPRSLGLSRERLLAAGFTAAAGKSLAIAPKTGPIVIAAGMGPSDELSADRIRDAAAAFARAASAHSRLAFSLDGLEHIRTDVAAQAAIEGILLGRYEFAGFGRNPTQAPVEEVSIVGGNIDEDEARAGAERGQACAEATILARNLANSPHNYLTATQLGRVATDLGDQKGFEVEIFGKEALQRLGCGGLLGVNAGSVEPPCMIKLVYRPAERASGTLALVGKGVMYDSGGISLKPNDNVHARMKNDMSGAAAVLAAMAPLRELGCKTTVTGFLMCTDNMPSGTAQALGDVITTHGGRTVEVTNTDAEGRLILCDALAIAAEEGHDAIVDIATLTGSVMRALGTDLAGLFGNHPRLLDQVRRAAEISGEPVWQLPLHEPYRKVLDSDVASMRNTGPTGGSQPDGIVAALYLAEFVGTVPWAHIDICGTAWHEKDELWRRAGCSGFGARLLIELATHFEPPAPGSAKH
jgi:leucyl aminopeptidase